MIGTLEATFTFRNMETTDALRDHALDKLAKLDKYLANPASAHIIFNLDGSRHVAEITLNVKGGRYVGTEASNDMYSSIDAAVEKIKRQMSRKKERMRSHKGE